MKPGKTGLSRLFAASKYSIAGLKFAWQNEAAFRQEALLFLILLPLAIYLGKSSVEIVLMIGSCMLVLIIEILNTAIEAVVDRIGPEHHPLAGSAKDLGSAAVMASIMLAIITWVTVLAYP